MDGDRGEYRESPPDAGLGRMVACRWTCRIGEAEQVFRVVPDGCVDVVWDGRDLYVAGPDTGPHLAVNPPGTVLAGVRLRPGTAPPALGVPAHALRDSRVPLTELWPRDETSRLAEFLAAAPDAAASNLERAVAARLRRGGPPDPAAAAVVASLSRGGDVASTAARVGLSERQLHRRCIAAFGYAPKVLQRVLRFDRAVKLAWRGIPFAEVAAVAGYADQAHLAREVKALAGVPLGDLVDRVR